MKGLKKVIIKSLSVMLAVVLTFTAAPLSGFVGLELPKWLDFSIMSSAATSGTCGDNLTWTFDESIGTLTISGTGAMSHYSTYSPQSPWYSLRTQIISVVFETGVTSIGRYAFYECHNLTSITISESVTSIGGTAFEKCASLTSFTVNSNNKNFSSDEYGVLFNKTKTTLIKYPNSKKSNSYIIPDSVTSIGEYAFENCSNLTSITIPNRVKTIGKSAFYGCKKLTSVTIPDGVTSINNSTFRYCSSLQSVKIPDSVKQIYDMAFAYCYNLTSITIPDSVTSIASGTFMDCRSLKCLRIHDSINSIGYQALSGCESLTSITVDPNNQYYSNDEYGVLFDKNKTTLMKYPAGNTRTSYTVPNNVTSIVSEAFSHSTSLTSVTIPDTVTTIGRYAFEYCTSLTNITIPDSVTSIDEYTFRSCCELASIIISNGVTSIGDYAFYSCTSLTSITIPDSVTTIGDYAFALYSTSLTDVYYSGTEEQWNKILIDSNNWCLTNATIHFNSMGVVSGACGEELTWTFDKSTGTLTISGTGDMDNYINEQNNTTIDRPWEDFIHEIKNIIIGDSVTAIGDRAFLDCTYLTYVDIGRSVTSIGDFAFYFCIDLTDILIPEKVRSIGELSFSNCLFLENITLHENIAHIGVQAFICCDSLKNVYYSGTEQQWHKITIEVDNDCLTNATIHYNSIGPDSGEIENSFYLLEDLVFLDKNEYFKLSALSDDGTDITDYLTWKTNDSSVAEVVSPGYILARSEGLITVSAEKSSSEMDYCYIYVGDPNHIGYSTIYDKDYYYNGNGFYSNAAQISNAVDIYLSLENCIADEMQSMYDKDALLGTYEDEFNSLEVGEFTVTATVSGNDLSFSRDSYSNTYSETFSNIPIETIVDDILVLYPYGLTVNSDKKSYTVKVKIESDDFETIEDTITFSVSNLVSKAANEHIDFLDTNLTYKTSLHNSYGTNMVKLKDDEEYKFSKYSTFDFDNYYEIVVGDLLINVLNVQKTGNISLLPTVVTEYNGVINSVISTINTIVYDDYGEALDISETAIDKFIKTSKYRDDGIYAENVVFQAIQKVCGNTDNADKINKVFAAADKTKQVFKFLNFGLDTINNIIDFTNRISVFNAYNDASNSFKEVFEKLYESIPASETKMREAVKDYINYADNGFAMTAEIIEAYGDLSKKVGTDAITTYLGKSFIDLTSGMVCEWIGSITLSSGATFASTAAFATVQAAFGGFLTGAAIGLCLADLCCNSSEKAAEMGKIIAMSEYSPYIIEMVKYYENNLRTNKNDYAVELFEHAFAIHKVSQVYITEHTIKALEIKRDSIIENLFDRKGEYEQVIADTLSIKYQLENMICHSNDTTASVVRKTKVIAIKCPVDIFVYDEAGNIVVEIRNDILEYCADGIGVCISESEKYICVPAENEYEVKIVSTGEGTMDYIVFEYDESAELESKKKIDSIPLSVGKEFNGTIYETIDDNSQNYIYSLTSGEDEYFTQEDNCTIEGHTTTLINYEASSCTKDGYSGDVYCENCQRIIEYGESIESTGHIYENGACTVCGEKDPSIPDNSIYNYTFSIQTPSRTEIRNKDGIILHANVEGNAPEGSYVRWESSNGNFDEDANGNKLETIAKNKGWTTFTAVLCDADGNELARDSVEMYSKSGFFDKIGGFFRSLFGGTKIYEY